MRWDHWVAPFALVVLCFASCDLGTSPQSAWDLSGSGYHYDAGVHDFAYHSPPPYNPDFAIGVPDLAQPSDMSGLTTGIPTIHCTTDHLVDALPTQSIYMPDGITDFVGLCGGWVAVVDHDQKQIGFFNPVTHETASNNVLDGSPGRLVLVLSRTVPITRVASSMPCASPLAAKRPLDPSSRTIVYTNCYVHVNIEPRTWDC